MKVFLILFIFSHAGILNGSKDFVFLDGPELTITVNETNGGSYDCIAFNDTDYTASKGYLFVNPVVDDQLTQHASDVTFVCESSFPSPDESYRWIRDPPDAEPEDLSETRQSLIISATFDDAGTIYTCAITADVSGYTVDVSDGGLLIGKDK